MAESTYEGRNNKINGGKNMVTKNTVTAEDMKKLPKIVAVDFDGTLVEEAYPQIGKPKKDTFELCKKLKEKGIRIILWTCRDGKQLKEAVTYCKFMGLEFDAVNTNISEIHTMFNNDTRKVYADIYLDDKSLHISGLQQCLNLLEE